MQQEIAPAPSPEHPLMESAQNTAVALLDFKDLAAVYEANKSLSDRAWAILSSAIKKIPQIDIKNISVQDGDALEAEFNDLRTRAADAEKLNKERRMVFTKRMDEVKSMFTTMEKSLYNPAAELKTWCDNWNAEKLARAEEIRKKNELKIAQENAKVDFKAHVASQMRFASNNHFNQFVSKMTDAFYSKTLDEIDAYVPQLQQWEPEFSPCEYQIAANGLLTPEEMEAIKVETEAEVIPVLQQDWVLRMKKERDEIVARHASRKAELQRIATDAAEADKAAARIAKEKAEKDAALSAEAAKKEADEQAKANAAKMNNVLEQAAIAPAVGLSKGASQKKKYNPTAHKDFISIIQFWATNCMQLMTVAELNKKLSFMVTAANKALNSGEVLEGIAVVDDVTTRARKKKEEE